MPKFPKEYLEVKVANTDEIFTPNYKFDSRGRLVMPLTPYHKMILSTLPGSQDIKGGSESPSSTPETDPGSLKTGSLYATTVITVGGTIVLDAANSRISVGADPGVSGYSFIIGNSYLMGLNAANIRFGFFLADYNTDLKAGDLIIGNTAGSYIFWDDSLGTLTVNGSIIVSGTIGGWTIATGYLYAGSGFNTAGMSPADWPFWAGDTYANRSIAAFRVDPAGNVYGTKFYHSGGQVGSTAVATVETGAVKANLGLDVSGFVQKVIQGANITGTPTTGINMTNEYVGYYNGATWPVYIKNDGKFMFQGNAGNYITWDGAILNVRGTLNADDITAGTLTGRVVRTDSGADRVQMDVSGTYAHQILWYSGGILAGRISTIGMVFYVQNPQVGGSIMIVTGDGIQASFLNGVFYPKNIYPSVTEAYDIGYAGIYWRYLFLSSLIYFKYTNDAYIQHGDFIVFKFPASTYVIKCGGDVLPNSDGVPSLGGTSNKWKNLYMSGVLYLGNLGADPAEIEGAFFYHTGTKHYRGCGGVGGGYHNLKFDFE
jgi:hypothetical protein